MLLKKINVIIVLLFCIIIRRLPNDSTYQKVHLNYQYNTPNKKRELILQIPKINLKVSTSTNVNLNDGLEIHLISHDNNNALVISGHSGIGANAYFNDLFKLRIGDNINVYQENLKYIYYLEQIIPFEKGSKLQINKEKIFLYLVTCDLYDMQKQWIFSSKLAKIEEN